MFVTPLKNLIVQDTIKTSFTAFNPQESIARMIPDYLIIISPNLFPIKLKEYHIRNSQLNLIPGIPKALMPIVNEYKAFIHILLYGDLISLF